MNRRKGETTARRNEREFPHLVELAVPTGGFQDQHLEFDTFHREQGIPIRGGSGHREEGQCYVRFCFPHADLAYAFRARFGGEYVTYPPKRFRRLALKRSGTKYEPRIFEGRVMMPDEIERIHKGLLEFEHINAISDPMRELIEELWPELVHKLPPRSAT